MNYTNYLTIMKQKENLPWLNFSEEIAILQCCMKDVKMHQAIVIILIAV